MIGKKYKKLNQKGQTLLFVVVAVSIALAIGVSVSSRTLSSLRRVSRTDTSSRVIAVAEGGIENLLNKNYSLLEGAMNPSEESCVNIGATLQNVQNGEDSYENKCVYDFTASGTSVSDSVQSRAIVTVEKYSSNISDGGYAFDIDVNTVKEVSLDGYASDRIEVCWENPDSAIYYYSYSKNEAKKGGLYTSSSSSIYGKTDNFESVLAETGSGYAGCKTIDLVTTPNGLRIRALYGQSKVAVFPDSGNNLPDQGFKLTSVGEITPSDANKEVATVIVHKSFPYASSVFDYGIYTPQALQ